MLRILGMGLDKETDRQTDTHAHTHARACAHVHTHTHNIYRCAAHPSSFSSLRLEAFHSEPCNTVTVP